MQELLDRYIDQNRLYSFEGERGVRNITQIVGAVGAYRSLDEFLADNPGAVEALYTWIGEQNVPEWREKLATEVGELDDEDDPNEFLDDEEQEGDDPMGGEFVKQALTGVQWRG